MQRDLLDALRCPHPHAEQWLVALVHEAKGAEIRSADLACPRCDAQFPVREGIADFRLTPSFPMANVDAVVSDDVLDGVRLAALLGVGEAMPRNGLIPLLLAGRETRAAEALAGLGAAPQLWLDPVGGSPPQVAPHCWAILQVDDRLPLGRGTLAGAALDAAHARRARLVEAVALAIRPGGRLVAPAETPIPPDVTILARDAQQWVGEVTASPGGLVTLRRQSPPA